MSTTAREYLMFVREKQYETPDLVGGAPNTGCYGYIRLDRGNGFTVRPNQQSVNVMYGGGVPIPVTRVPGNIAVAGTLTTLLHYSQANTLLGWALTRINSSRTVPWVTTNDAAGKEGPGDLASMSLYHAYRGQDGGYIKRIYRGAKVASCQIQCSADAPLALLTLNVEASLPIPNDTFGGSNTNTEITTTEFPDPTDASYPTDVAHFFHTNGQLTFGTTRTLYSSLGVNVTNRTVRFYGETPWPQVITTLGRESRCTFRSLVRSTVDDRHDYESSTAKSVSVGFNTTINSVVHTITINYHAQNRHDTPPADDLPIDNVYAQEINLLNYYDPVANTDISVTAS